MNQETQPEKEQQTSEEKAAIERREEQMKIVKSVAKTFLLSLFVLCSLFGCVVLSLPVLAPNFAIKVYSSLGYDGAALSTREMKYERTGKIEDLYNLVIEARNQKQWTVLEKYSQKLLSHDDFSSFAASYETYAAAKTNKANLYAVASLEDYAERLQVEAIYHQDRARAFEKALICFENEKTGVFYFAEYINCVMNDEKYTANKKIDTIEVIAKTEIDGKNVLQLVSERYAKLKPENLEQADLLLIERLWEIKNVQLSLEDATFDANYETTKAELEELSNIIESKLA